MTTIAEIAHVAGVSEHTASRALRGLEQGLRSDAKARAERIRKIAQERGYRPNAAARAMKARCTGNIALINSTDSSVRSNLHSEMLHGIAGVLETHRMHLILSQMSDAQLTDPGYVPQILQEWACDGLLINYHVSIPARLPKLIRKHRIPSIWINVKLAADCVYPDDLAAGRIATEHLLALGHRRIGYVDYFNFPDHHYSRDDRRQGYLDAMAAAGLAPDLLVPAAGDNLEPRAREATHAWLQRGHRPTAVVAYGSNYAELFTDAAARLGLFVPDHISLAAIANNALGTVSGMSTTSVVVAHHEVGAVAAHLLLDKLKTGTDRFDPVAVPPRLYVSGSSGPPPAGGGTKRRKT